MPISIREALGSGSFGSNQSATTGTRLYFVEGTDDEFSAYAYAYLNTPTDMGGVPRVSVNVEVHEGIESETWLATVTYSNQPQGSSFETESNQYGFETGQGRSRVYVGLQSMGNYGLNGDAAPDFGAAINVSEDKVEGVDIVTPQPTFTETVVLPIDVVTNGYKRLLNTLCGSVNNAAFRSYQPGEVLFVGAQGEQITPVSWRVTFKFMTSDNVVGQMFDGIGPVTKEGWDYLWFRFQERVDTGSGALIRKAVSGHVVRVYRRADFGFLGIGTL